MGDFYNYIIDRIEKVSPRHANKLRNSKFDEAYGDKFEEFFKNYEIMLQKQNLTLDYAVDSYLKFCNDMLREQINFMHTGKYSNTSFAEVNKNVYDNPEVMNYHMHGLLVSEFLWLHHYKTFKFFCDFLDDPDFLPKNILEIGGGHGLYTNEVIKRYKHSYNFTMVDISESSIALSKAFVKGDKVKYNLLDVFEFESEEKFDFIIMGEVLEHVEDPISLMKKLNDLGSLNAKAFISTPCNAPSIDHIYLFRNAYEVIKVFHDAGWEVIKDQKVYAEEVNDTISAVPMMYAAFIKKK